MQLIHRIVVQQIFLILLMMLSFSIYANENFVHGISIKLQVNADHRKSHYELYHFAGPPDGVNGATDIPGHEWVQKETNRFLGRHLNTGPFGAPDFWSSDAGNNQILYNVEAIIDGWSEVKALEYFTKGFVQYHRLLNAETKRFHANKVVWLKRVAVKNFRLDGAGVLDFGDGIEAYDVIPGVDYKLSPNWNIPYDPSGTCCHL